jgi:hypothetical protein
LFSDYGEFLRLTRPLPLEHKQKIFDALPTQEKRQLKRVEAFSEDMFTIYNDIIKDKMGNSDAIKN